MNKTNLIVQEASRIAAKSVIAPRCVREGKIKKHYMNFEEILPLIKQGKRARRQEWNKQNFVFLVDGSKFKVNRKPLLGIYPEGTQISYHAHIDYRCSNGTIVPWSPGMQDILANDWTIEEK